MDLPDQSDLAWRGGKGYYGCPPIAMVQVPSILLILTDLLREFKPLNAICACCGLVWVIKNTRLLENMGLWTCLYDVLEEVLS